MEFKTSKEILLKALQKIQGISTRKTTMPILSNALLEIKGSNLNITATDLEVGIKSSYQVEVVKEGKITVNSSKLIEIIRELPNEQISFIKTDNDWVEIKCGKIKFNIVGLSADEFPYFPEINEDNLFDIESLVLKDMIDKTSYAICNDDTKYNLNGVFVKTEESVLKMVATDGHRLSVVMNSLENINIKELEKGIILPKKGITELRKISDESTSKLKFGFIDNSAVVKAQDSYMVMRLVDGEFPDYNRVIPKTNDKLIKVNRDEFMASVKRMSILSSEKFKGILLEIENSVIKISSSNPELGDAVEELDCDYSSTPISVRFNAKYLQDVLQISTSKEVVLQLKDELSPAIIQPSDSDNLLAVIMPMRL